MGLKHTHGPFHHGHRSGDKESENKENEDEKVDENVDEGKKEELRFVGDGYFKISNRQI